MRSSLGMAACIAFGLLGAIGFVPLFGGPGYEHSLASGLIVPTAAAIETSLAVSASPRGSPPSPLACVARGLASGAVLAAVAYFTALAHGVRVGVCDFASGTVFFVLTAGFGALLGGVWGAVVGEACRGARWTRTGCVLLALAAPLGGIVVSVARFCTSPIIFSYDPFFGYFSGALYDTIVDVRPELWTYRAGSAASLSAAVLIAAALSRTSGGALSFSLAESTARRKACLASGLALAFASLSVFCLASQLGHAQTGDTIARALGGRTSGPRCDVVYPDSLASSEATLLVRDCEEELTAVEARLGAALGQRVTVYEFADAEQKRRLMGAADTSIAKPWRREVYIQLAPYPHPVLGHELAHVVAGVFAHGPFRVGGGLIPNPGLIEGIAVAASPDDDALTAAQWARAMLDLDILPDLGRIFSLGFLGESAGKSYTVAGAFVGWALDRFGADVVRKWYGGRSLENLAGLGWKAIGAEFRAWLRALAMPPEIASYARARFDRPSVWGRRCPHQVDALNHAGDQCRDARRVAAAEALYSAALSRDPGDFRARFERAKLEVRYGDEVLGRAALARIAGDEGSPRTFRDRAEEALADDDLARGRSDAAREAYRDVASRTFDEDAARTLDVKMLGSDDKSTDARRMVLDLLVGDPGRPVDPWVAALSIGQRSESAAAPLASYLAGRNLALRGEWQRADVTLGRALSLGPPTVRIGRELLRLRAITACVLEDRAELEALKASVQDGSPFYPSSDGRKSALLRLISRCAR